MNRLAWLIFILGCVTLIAAFGIGWADWGNLANQAIVMQVLMGAVGVVATFLAAVGFLSKGKQRWEAFTMTCFFLLGTSALVFFSIGWMVAPVAVILQVFCLVRMRRYSNTVNAG